MSGASCTCTAQLVYRAHHFGFVRWRYCHFCVLQPNLRHKQPNLLRAAVLLSGVQGQRHGSDQAWSNRSSRVGKEEGAVIHCDQWEGKRYPVSTSVGADLLGDKD